MSKPLQVFKNFTHARLRLFVIIAFFSSVINVLMLTPSIYMLQVYDRALSSGNTTTLFMLTLLVLFMFTIMALMDYARGIIIIRLGNQFDNALSPVLYTAACESNLIKRSPNAGQAISDLAVIRQFVTGPALFAVFDSIWFPVYIGVIFLFNTWLGLFSLSGAFVLLALAFINEKITRQLLNEAGGYALVSNHQANSTLQCAETLQALGMTENVKARWWRAHRQFLYCQSAASERAVFMSAITKTVRMALQSLMLGLGCWLAILGDISPGMMIAGSILLGRALAPVEQLISVAKGYRSARQAWGRMVHLTSEFPPALESIRLPEAQGLLTVENVTVFPPGNSRQPILHNINLRVEPGEVLGIVGASASGKSCLAKVLCGVWPAGEGDVRLDGADIYQWQKQKPGPGIGYLPQDVALFTGTIAENIAHFGEIDSTQLIATAKMAGIHEMILRMPEGYNTLTGEQGTALSGGQKQRIGLARALYGNPALVILDEPNANLDESGEKALQQVIRQLKQQKKSVVIISHRPGILPLTSHLLVLEGGKSKLYGPTEQLLQQSTRPVNQTKSVPVEQGKAHA
ncbi:Lipase secretion B [Enterobacter cloacae]|uniref:type I secretion system permease/ATPase n=1 Tax=Enterobacter cloacae TaxID=550 RepID=UPI0007964B16|nr:type I secretion system permease/ATPase [Enterobacter cloacae]SAD76030.1 Lipase secretion B [Enterobacter cloacae]